MLATDDMALSYSQQLAILLSINHALIHLDGGLNRDDLEGAEEM